MEDLEKDTKTHTSKLLRLKCNNDAPPGKKNKKQHGTFSLKWHI